MTKRTPEEIRAQREAMLAARAARAAGQAAPPPPSPAEPPAEPPAEAPVAAPAAPEAPERKRTPEEVKAQREAMLAARAARAAGTAAPAAVAEAPAPSTPAVAAPAAPVVETPRPAPKPTEAKPAPPPAAPAPIPVDPNLTRREFLNYAWLASIGLLSLEIIGLSLWFAFPNFKEGQFGGAFPIGEASNAVPEVNADPKAYTDGKFWLVNLDMDSPDGESRKGIMAIYKVCTHLGCLYEWVPMTSRFECPCHGSKFALSADYLAGPARRSLDRFVIQAISPDGSIKETDANGNPLEITGDERLVVDTGRRILGEPVVTPA